MISMTYLTQAAQCLGRPMVLALSCALVVLGLSACSKSTAPGKKTEGEPVELESLPELPIADEATEELAVQVKRALPQSADVAWVLDGTDLREKKIVKGNTIQSVTQWGGKYRSEQGGSILNLQIIADSSDAWVLSREYSEPGLKVAAKNYQLQPLNDSLVSQDADIVVQKTLDGVLVLELNSGIDSIPSSYWVHYLQVK
ncbi:MAG: hypothetical protein KTR17_03530 [Cellvibrionaceae bacterium]|nr:hypothetical protein [Cellvibrionaceae bacterium]